MRAAYFYGTGDVRLEQTNIPEIADDEILVNVKASAICGTDLRIYKFGHFKIPDGAKRVLGHELSGVIAKVGKNITNYKAGERVAVPPNVGCGTCPMCQQGYNQLCPDYEAFGISYDGGFQEYMVVPAAAVAAGNVVRIPDELSYEVAAMVEPFSCTYHSYKALRTVPGDTVVIIGAGPIGACHVMINKLAGAAKIIVADVSDSRLTEIKKFGADIIINSQADDLKEAVLDHTNNKGANVVITACSVPEVQQTALEIAAIHARINFFGGIPKGKEGVTLYTNLIHYKELTVLGTTGSSMNDYLESINIATSGKIDLAALATDHYSLKDIQKAFDNSLAGAGMKTLIINAEEQAYE